MYGKPPQPWETEYTRRRGTSEMETQRDSEEIYGLYNLYMEPIPDL